jgi:hypothetical protein
MAPGRNKLDNQIDKSVNGGFNSQVEAIQQLDFILCSKFLSCKVKCGFPFAKLCN